METNKSIYKRYRDKFNKIGEAAKRVIRGGEW